MDYVTRCLLTYRYKMYILYEGKKNITQYLSTIIYTHDYINKYSLIIQNPLKERTISFCDASLGTEKTNLIFPTAK